MPEGNGQNEEEFSPRTADIEIVAGWLHQHADYVHLTSGVDAALVGRDIGTTIFSFILDPDLAEELKVPPRMLVVSDSDNVSGNWCGTLGSTSDIVTTYTVIDPEANLFYRTKKTGSPHGKGRLSSWRTDFITTELAQAIQRANEGKPAGKAEYIGMMVSSMLTETIEEGEPTALDELTGLEQLALRSIAEFELSLPRQVDRAFAEVELEELGGGHKGALLCDTPELRIMALELDPVPLTGAILANKLFVLEEFSELGPDPEMEGAAAIEYRLMIVDVARQTAYVGPVEVIRRFGEDGAVPGNLWDLMTMASETKQHWIYDLAIGRLQGVAAHSNANASAIALKHVDLKSDQIAVLSRLLGTPLAT
jgi:hypothetical protein